MQYQWPWRTLQLAGLVFLPSCVTHTESIPYRGYDPHRDESALDELKREFGWRKNKYGEIEAPYTRAARSVKETASEWFSDEELGRGSAGESLQQLKQDQEEAIRRLQEMQEQDRIDQSD